MENSAKALNHVSFVKSVEVMITKNGRWSRFRVHKIKRVTATAVAVNPRRSILRERTTRSALVALSDMDMLAGNWLANN